MHITESKLRSEIRRLIKEGVGDLHLFFVSTTYEHHFMFNSQWLYHFKEAYNDYDWGDEKVIEYYYPNGLPQIIDGKNCFSHGGVSEYGGGGTTTVILVPDDYSSYHYKNFLKTLPDKFRITTDMPHNLERYFQK